MPDLPDDDQWLLLERRRIGRRIRDVRTDHKLTQEQVFLSVPMNRSHYQQIESGDANVSLDMLLRISRALGVHVADLLCR